MKVLNSVSSLKSNHSVFKKVNHCSYYKGKQKVEQNDHIFLGNEKAVRLVEALAFSENAAIAGFVTFGFDLSVDDRGTSVCIEVEAIDVCSDDLSTV
jgi:hypothetical protein